MLPKVLIAFVSLVGLFFLIGTLFRPNFWQDLKPKGNTPISNIGIPSCPDPLVLQTPVDVNKVTGILYPGQERGGHFKYHGGFRFDNSKTDEIEVKAPMDGSITDAVGYIENGKVQYMFDFQNDCGIRYRFDHLVTLSPKLAEIAEKLPEPKVNDSRTTRINESIKVTAGEVIATSVGYQNNVFVDFGVYDTRQDSPLQSFQEKAVCWFDLLETPHSAYLKTLPAGKEGKTSTLCK